MIDFSQLLRLKKFIFVAFVISLLSILLVNEYNILLLISIIYLIIIAMLLPLFKTFPLGLLMLFVLTYPPFVEFELAITAIIAFKRDVGVREFISLPLISFLEILFFVLFFISVRNFKEKKLTLVELLLIMLMLITGLSTIYNFMDSTSYFVQMATLAGFINYTKIFLIYVITRYSVKKIEDVKKLFLFVVLSLPLFLGQSFYVTYEKYGHLNIGNMQMTGLIPGPGPMGAFLVLVIPLIFVYFINVKNSFFKTYLFLILIISLGYALATFTRSVYLGIIFDIILIIGILSLIKRLRKFIPFILIILTVLTIFAFKDANDFYIYKLDAMFTEDKYSSINLQARLFYWEEALSLVKQNKLLGIGPSTWALKSNVSGYTPHNGYLQVLVEIGFIGFIIFVWVIFLGIIKNISNIRYFRTKKDIEFYIIFLGILASIMAYLVTQFFSSSMLNIRIMTVFWSLLAVNFRTYELIRKIGDDKSTINGKVEWMAE